MGYAIPSLSPKKAKLILETNVPPKKGHVAGINDQIVDDKKDELINNEILKLEGGDGSSEKNDMVNGIALKQNDKIAPPKAKANAAPAAAKDAHPNKKDEDSKDDEEEDEGVYDAAAGLAEIRSLAPMIVFSKTYCGFSKKIKKLLLENYQITPAPMYVELDKHAHGSELQAYLAEVSGRTLVPNALVGSSDKSRGGADDFAQWHADGSLELKLNEWGNKKVVAIKIDPPSNL